MRPSDGGSDSEVSLCGGCGASRTVVAASLAAVVMVVAEVMETSVVAAALVLSLFGVAWREHGRVEM